MGTHLFVVDDAVEVGQGGVGFVDPPQHPPCRPENVEISWQAGEIPVSSVGHLDPGGAFIDSPREDLGNPLHLSQSDEGMTLAALTSRRGIDLDNARRPLLLPEAKDPVASGRDLDLSSGG
jgi:hypothetical protein